MGTVLLVLGSLAVGAFIGATALVGLVLFLAATGGPRR